MVTPPASLTDVLQKIIKSSAERQRLSSALGVTNMTLTRWASGESKPQRSHLIRLIQVVQPNHRQELLDAIQRQHPDMHSWLSEDSSDLIPSDFFAQVLNIRTTTTESLRFWRICEAILKQALAQLDPHHLGMAIKLVQCMPPTRKDGKIRSLRECVGKGTPPWTADLEHDVHFLGLESLSGTAVEMRHMVYEDDLRKPSTLPRVRDTNEISAAANPIRFEGRIAGCLLASSAQANYFTQPRLALLTTFSDLISLAFDKKEFYSPHLIQLRVMPAPEIQRPYLMEFRPRVTRRFQEAMQKHQHMNNSEIELETWQELEEELLNLAASDGTGDSSNSHHPDR
jgi:hypothetical protein